MVTIRSTRARACVSVVVRNSRRRRRRIVIAFEKLRPSVTMVSGCRAENTFGRDGEENETEWRGRDVKRFVIHSFAPCLWRF